MSSILPGFEYDIFISYRHNDNRSGWVTEFVKALQEELASTIKDPVSVYFDTNPHDGLLETHNVDKSLEGKLKCLIFIPIISQTYCDPKSFAWQHEFCAFNRMAKEDSLGMDVKLSNGNIASRILPVKIHDLDPQDKTVLEAELGGVLRAIEFIYTEAGVNRPLLPPDSRKDNLNKTDYRNQVNKLANAARFMIHAIISRDSQNPEGSHPPVNNNSKSAGYKLKPPIHRRKMFIGAVLFALLASLSLIPKYLFTAKTIKGKAKILVVPFRIDTRDSSQQYFSNGVTIDIITELAKVGDLSTFPWETAFNYINSRKSLTEICEETSAGYVLTGSIRRDHQMLRINVQLVDPIDNEILWTDVFDREEQFTLAIQREIATKVAKALRVQLSPEEIVNLQSFQTRNFEAYDLFLQARNKHKNLTLNDNILYDTERLLNKALELDPEFTDALTLLALVKIDQTWFYGLNPLQQAQEAKIALARSMAIKPNSPDAYIVLGGVNFFLEWNMVEARKNLEQGYQLSHHNETPIYHCLCNYVEFIEATGELKRALAILNDIKEIDPFYPFLDVERFLAYRMLNDHESMESILANPQGELSLGFLPAYYYDLTYYEKSIASFRKQKTTSIYPTTHLASAYFKAGHQHESDSLINVLIQESGTRRNVDLKLAVVYAARRDKKEAIKWFKRAYQNRDFFIVYSKLDVDLKFIINEPEIKQILREIGVE